VFIKYIKTYVVDSMRLFKQVTTNDVELRPLPFLRELSMESYLVENESILKLD